MDFDNEQWKEFAIYDLANEEDDELLDDDLDDLEDDETRL